MTELLATLLVQGLEWRLRYMSTTRKFGLWVLLGAVCGWIAGKLSAGKGFGFVGDTVLGMLGAVAGGWVFMKTGIADEDALTYSLIASALGAVLLVFVGHVLFKIRGQ